MTVDRSDAASFDTAFDACFLAAYQAAYRILATDADAEDIAQEALARAYLRWRGIRSYAEPWVVRVATNLALDATRRARRRQPAGAVVAASDEADARLDLARAIADLPRRQREVVSLRFIADLSEADVATVLGISVGAAKQHAHRGLAALRASGHLASEES